MWPQIQGFGGDGIAVMACTIHNINHKIGSITYEGMYRIAPGLEYRGEKQEFADALYTFFRIFNRLVYSWKKIALVAGIKPHVINVNVIWRAGRSVSEISITINNAEFEQCGIMIYYNSIGAV